MFLARKTNLNKAENNKESGLQGSQGPALGSGQVVNVATTSTTTVDLTEPPPGPGGGQGTMGDTEARPGTDQVQGTEPRGRAATGARGSRGLRSGRRPRGRPRRGGGRLEHQGGHPG